MARKPRSEWSAAYRARIESYERRHPGRSRAEARGAHEDEPTYVREHETTSIVDRLADHQAADADNWIESNVHADEGFVRLTLWDADGNVVDEIEVPISRWHDLEARAFDDDVDIESGSP